MIASRLRSSAPRVVGSSWQPEERLLVLLLIVVGLLHSAVTLSLGEAADDSPLIQVVWGGVYLFAAVRLAAFSELAQRMAKKSISLLIFLGLILASSIWSSDPFATFKAASELIGTTLVGWYVVSRFSLSEFLRIVAVAFTIMSVLSVILIFGSPARGRMDWGAGPYSGVFGEKNGLGAAMALSIMTVALLLPSARGKTRVLLAGVLALSVWLLAGSNSITAFLACTGALVVVAIAWVVQRRMFAALAALLFAAGVGVVCFGFLGLDSGSFFDSLGRNANLTGRTDIWPPVITAIQDKPLLGYGYDSFFNSGPYQDYLSDFLAKYNWVPPHAHESFLQIALDTGLVGLGIFLVVLTTALWRDVSLLRRMNPGSGAIYLWPFGIVVYLILGSYDETYFTLRNSLEWIFFVVALLYPLRELMVETPTLPIRKFGNARDA